MSSKKLCYLAELGVRELSKCENSATYKCEIQLSNGHTLVRYLCSEHTSHVSRIAKAEIARLFKAAGTPVAIECVRLNARAANRKDSEKQIGERAR